MAQLNDLIVTGNSRFINRVNANGGIKSSNSINQIITGTGTAASSSGTTYYPAKWTFNIGTATDGDIVTIKIPVAGHDYGVYMSTDNGTTYYPIVCNSTGRLTTHYPVNNYITVVFEPGGSAASMFPVAGGSSRVTVTGGVWRVINYYDSNSDQNAMYIRYYNNVLAKTALTAEKLIVGDTDGYNIAAGGTQFNISFPILWITAAVSAGASNYANMYIQTYDRNLTNVKSGFASTANKAIYMPVTLSGNIATIDNTLLTDTLPNSDDGKVYIRLGKLGAQSTGANYFFFEPVHPMFWYKNGAIRQFAQDASTVNGLTVQKAVPASAEFTDTQSNWNETSTTSKAYIQNKPTLPTVTDTYSATSSNAMSGKAVASALSTLDGTVSGTAGSSKTLTAFSQTDGKVSATFGNISITKSQVSDFPTIDTTVTSGSSNLVTSGAVYTAIDNLPEPMVFKGTLGTGGTITSLPTASSANEGFTYKVITAGTYASTSAKVGDVFVSNGSSWVLIPSGDTDSDTWRNIKVNGTEKLTTAISSGAVDFVNGTGTTASFTTSGSKVAYNVTYGTRANTGCQGNDSRLSDARTPTSHTHGNIQNGGTLQTTDVTIANGDKLVITDSSDSSKVARASIAFDGSTTTKALTQKGTFETFATTNTDRYVNQANFDYDSTNDDV